MCLKITHVPTSPTSCILYHGYKRLEAFSHDKYQYFCTPVIGVRIARDGWLYPDPYYYHPPAYYHRDRGINHHHIHFYTRATDYTVHSMEMLYDITKTPDIQTDQYLAPCFAINVRAFDDDRYHEHRIQLFNRRTSIRPDGRMIGHGAAAAIYIPSCDKTPARDKTTNLLLNAPKTKRQAYLHKHFPHLAPYLFAVAGRISRPRP